MRCRDFDESALILSRWSCVSTPRNNLAECPRGLAGDAIIECVYAVLEDKGAGKETLVEIALGTLLVELALAYAAYANLLAIRDPEPCSGDRNPTYYS